MSNENQEWPDEVTEPKSLEDLHKDYIKAATENMSRPFPEIPEPVDLQAVVTQMQGMFQRQMGDCVNQRIAILCGATPCELETNINTFLETSGFQIASLSSPIRFANDVFMKEIRYWVGDPAPVVTTTGLAVIAE